MNDDWKQWKFAGIYCIEHIESGKKYIGQSQNIYMRIFKHFTNANDEKYSHLHLYCAIRKYKWNSFRFLLLEKIANLTLLNEREQYWMDFYSSYDKKYGYNSRPTAETNRGWKHSEESNRKRSIVMKGRIPSVEIMELARKSRIVSVYQFDKNDNIIKKWNSISEAESETGINHGNICWCCKGKRKTAGGYKWKYANKESENLNVT